MRNWNLRKIFPRQNRCNNGKDALTLRIVSKNSAFVRDTTSHPLLSFHQFLMPFTPQSAIRKSFPLRNKSAHWRIEVQWSYAEAPLWDVFSWMKPKKVQNLKIHEPGRDHTHIFHRHKTRIFQKECDLIKLFSNNIFSRSFPDSFRQAAARRWWSYLCILHVSSWLNLVVSFVI